MKVWAFVLLTALQLGGQSFANPRVLLQVEAEDRVYTPEKGTPERKAILDAVRAISAELRRSLLRRVDSIFRFHLQ